MARKNKVFMGRAAGPNIASIVSPNGRRLEHTLLVLYQKQSRRTAARTQIMPRHRKFRSYHRINNINMPLLPLQLPPILPILVLRLVVGEPRVRNFLLLLATSTPPAPAAAAAVAATTAAVAAAAVVVAVAAPPPQTATAIVIVYSAE
jgi:hypothetical protein